MQNLKYFYTETQGVKALSDCKCIYRGFNSTTNKKTKVKSFSTLSTETYFTFVHYYLGNTVKE